MKTKWIEDHSGEKETTVIVYPESMKAARSGTYEVTYIMKSCDPNDDGALGMMLSTINGNSLGYTSIFGATDAVSAAKCLPPGKYEVVYRPLGTSCLYFWNPLKKDELKGLQSVIK